MTSQAIISLAILKVNSDILGKDYLENFVPIVAECIRLSEEDIVSLPVLQSDLEKHFGLPIPQNCINSILRRVKKRGYIKLEHKAYRRDNAALSLLNFHTIQQRVLRMHESVIAHLVEFCAERFDVSWSTEDAEQALLAYLEENQLSIVAYSRDFASLVRPGDSARKGAKYLIGVFIEHLLVTQSSDFEYLETIVKGNLLANAIFLTDPGTTSRRFRDTSVYFDTSFLIFALGHAGGARRDPCTELLQMLYETGADLRCFRHTLEEMRGILDACAHRIRQGQLREAYGPSIEYFISIGATPSDVELFAVNLERDLAALRVQVTDKPPYIPEYVIDEQKLTDKLNESVQYRNAQALQRDVDSVSAIMRLRRGQDYFAAEDCRALFVTTNNSVVRVSRDFFSDESPPSAVPPCMPDYVLTNLLWLKNPLRVPNLPRKRIIADYYAATQPEDRLWRQYLAEIDKLKQQRSIGADEYYLLRYSLEAKSALMEVTFGEEDAFTQGTISEIMEIVYSRIRKDGQEELGKQKELREQAEQTVESVVAKERERLVRIRLRAQRYAHILAKAIEVGFVLLLVIGTVSTFPWDLPAFREMPLSYLIPSLQVGLLILSIANLMYGTMLSTSVRRIETKLSGWIEKGILRLVES